MEKEFKKNDTVLYRGGTYKVKKVKKEEINNKEVIFLEIPHSKYTIWVNAKYVIKC